MIVLKNHIWGKYKRQMLKSNEFHQQRAAIFKSALLITQARDVFLYFAEPDKQLLLRLYRLRQLRQPPSGQLVEVRFV